MRTKKIIYVDMDDVVADYYKAAKGPDGKVIEERMFDKDFFLNLEPIPGAKAGIFALNKMGFDIWFLSQPLTLLPESYAHKAQWLQVHFPSLHNKLILTQDKGLHIGEYLIDDNFKKWHDKFTNTGGLFVHMQYGGYNLNDLRDPADEWEQIVNYFKTQDPNL